MAMTFSLLSRSLKTLHFATQAEWLHYVEVFSTQPDAPTLFNAAPERFPCTMVYRPDTLLVGAQDAQSVLANVFLYNCVEQPMSSIQQIPGLDIRHVVIEQLSLLHTPSGPLTVQLEARPLTTRDFLG